MPRPKAQRNDLKFKYSKHEIVWAKIVGYPWWPASITCTPSKSNCYYKVDFIGDRSYAYLSESKIAKYVQSRDQYQSNKKNNKHFSNAVTIAARRYQELLLKQGVVMKSKGSMQFKTSQQKQQLNKQIELPQIQEKIQQISSQNQNDKNILLDVKYQRIDRVQLSNNQFYLKQQLFEEPEQFSYPVVPSVQEKPVIQPIEQLNHRGQYQDKQMISLQQLLIKYKLDCIPELKQIKKIDQQNQSKKITWKRKLIQKGKRNSKQYSNQFGQNQLISRKIFKYLYKKINLMQQSMQISLNLQQQISKQSQYCQRVEYLKKLFDWIQISDNQHIVNYYSQWINFYKDNDRQRQKHSTLTMEDQSGESIQIK